MKLIAHATPIKSDDTPYILVHPASLDSVRKVLIAPESSDDGRSQYMWLRLPDGDLMLGVFPQGDTYFAVEDDAQYPNDGDWEVLWCETCGERPQVVHALHVGLCAHCAAHAIDNPEG